jgi:hypothetical protein
MSADPSADGPALKNRFGRGERLAMWLAFYGMVAVGTAGIWISSPAWALGYLAFALVGLLGPIVYGLCSHCPYPHHMNQCLFLSPALVRRLYRYRGPKMTLADGVMFIVPMAAIVLIPLIWLVRQPLMLAVFLVLVLVAASAPALYYCRRCRHVGCPVNRVRGSHRKEAWSAVSDTETR